MDFLKCIIQILKLRSSSLSICKYLFTLITNNSYDFDKDGYVKKEDVRLILSHIPIEKTLLGVGKAEGKFTSEGGGM